METTLVAPHCAGTSRICGKIKKSNVLHYICHFTSDKNNFLYSWLFFSLTWAENEHWQPLVALRPLEAVKSFISCPCDTGKQPLIPKIVSDTGKMTNEWSKVLLFQRRKSKWVYNFRPAKILYAYQDIHIGGGQQQKLCTKSSKLFLPTRKLFLPASWTFLGSI